jgi:hypothetical protein
MIHGRKMTMPQTAKALGCATMDVGELLIAHKRVLDAAAKDMATRAGACADVQIDVAAAELAHRERVFGKARKLVREGVEIECIAERLSLQRRRVNHLPEAGKRSSVSVDQRSAAGKPFKAVFWKPIVQVAKSMDRRRAQAGVPGG